jgi:hypothetical protein
MKNTTDVTGGKPIAVLLQSISGVSAINPLVAFYDIHGGEIEVLFIYFVSDNLLLLSSSRFLIHQTTPSIQTTTIRFKLFFGDNTYFTTYLII